jgi:3',5'-cyclic-AMP phosphodiesterase
MIRQADRIGAKQGEKMGSDLNNFFRCNKVTLIAIAVTLCGWFGIAIGCAQSSDYQRIVILSDAHLPYIPRETPDAGKEQRIVTAKQGIIVDINYWNDVTRIVATGDLVGSYGTEAEYAAARSFFGKLNKPVSFIVGNHDYMYIGRDPNFNFIRGNEEERRAKLERFKREFNQPQLYYAQESGRYLLVFLSTDSLDSKVLCQFSQEQMSWLEGVLAKNKNRPTIIFAHAPLAGTLTDYNQYINKPSFIAQPETEIRDLLRNNTQVFMWVSGHTHTPATNKDFDSPVNLYDGRVLDIQNPTLDGEVIWTNSLYLYPDKVVIKTFRHSDKKWLDDLERTIGVK